MGSEIIESATDTGFVAKGLNFNLVLKDYNNHKTTADEIVLLKTVPFLKSYDSIFATIPKRSLFEVGIFEGGSTLYYALAFPDLKIVAIDIRPPDDAVLRHIHDLGLSDRVTIHYQTSQADKEKIQKLFRDDFGGESVGIIIDDASHNYDLTRKSFELSFGHLAPGGSYCLEDWAWAHRPGQFQTTQWTEQKALSNLVLEMMMLMPSTSSAHISKIEAWTHMVRAVKGGAPKTDDLNLDDLILKRNREFVRL